MYDEEQAERLTLEDELALTIFLDTIDQWEKVTLPMGGAVRDFLPIERVKIATELLGYELTDELMERIRVLTTWQSEQDAAKLANKAEQGGETKQRDKEGWTVN